MKNSKLLQLAASLDKEEWKGLVDFLQSPYFNKREDVVALYRYLRPLHPDFRDVFLQKQQVWTAVYPGQEYREKQLHYVMSWLKQLIETYLAQRQLEKQQSHLALARFQALAQKGQEKALKREREALQSLLTDSHAVGEQHYELAYRWASLEEEHFQRQLKRQYDSSIQRATDSLDPYYFLVRLKLSCAMLDRQAILQTRYDLNITEEWLQHLQSQHCFEDELIKLYYTIFQALRHEELEENFQQLLQFLQDQTAAIPRAQLRDIYRFAINYCARKIRQGRDNFAVQALYLYRKGIEQEILIEDGELSPWTFTNVVKLSLRQDAHAAAEAFIERYAALLPDSFRHNAEHYNRAELYYYSNEYERAQEHLIEVVYTDLNYYLGARVLLAKIYFERGEEEVLLNLLSSFIIFLKRRTNLSQALKKTYLNFCQYLFQILRRSPRRFRTLREEISTTDLLTDRQWLLQAFDSVTQTDG